MLEIENHDQPTLHPLTVVILIMLTIGVGFVVLGPIIGFFLSLPFFPGGMLELTDAIQDPLNHPEVKIPFYIMQGAATLIGLIVAPMILLKVLHRSVENVFKSRSWYAIAFIITPIIVIVFMGLNSIFIEWNADFHFPEFLNGFETWAREREDYAATLTTFITKFDSIGELILGLVVIALLPAIGEEFVFRGLIQTELQKATRNPHVSIWIAAVLFSAIHMQFFGFVPRLLLGALFGYLYYWSGNLTMSIVAHFVNNGFAVVGMYLYQQGKFDFNVEGTDAAPLSAVLVSGVITAALLYYFRKIYRDGQSGIES